MLCYGIARFQPVSGLIFSVLLLATHAHADDSLNLIVSGVKLWTVMGATSHEKGS